MNTNNILHTKYKKKYKFVILGGGLCGLTTAYELSKTHYGDVLVIEKEASVGGMAKTIRKKGFCYDLGSHRIHEKTDPQILAYIKGLPLNIKQKERKGKIYIHNGFTNYPLRILPFIFRLGLKNIITCSYSFIKQKFVMQDKPDNYQDYIVSKIGSAAYQLFYEPYAYKIFTCHPNQISLTAVKKRVSLKNPLSIIKDSLFPKKHYFYYPSNGIGDIGQALEKKIHLNGGLIIKNNSSLRLNMRNKAVIIGKNKIIHFEKIISTITLIELAKLLAIPAKSIKKISWLGLHLVFLHFDKDPLLEGETFYFPEKKFIFGRVSIPKRFTANMLLLKNNCSYICEVPGHSKISANELYAQCHKALVNAKIIGPQHKPKQEKNFIVTLPHVYPQYIKNWQKHINKLLHYLAKKHPNLYVNGRLGLFLHNNLDQAIQSGITLAKHLENKQTTANDWLQTIEKLLPLFHVRD